MCGAVGCLTVVAILKLVAIVFGCYGAGYSAGFAAAWFNKIANVA